MDPFDAVSRGDVAALRDALAADPAAAASRNASGASLLAWAAYMRNPDAVASIRDLLPAIDPYEACILGEFFSRPGDGMPVVGGGIRSGISLHLLRVGAGSQEQGKSDK